MPHEKAHSENGCVMSLLTATGEASQFIGKVDLEIKLGVHVFKHEFLLAEIKDTTILGMGFFMRHKIDSTNIFTLASIKYPSP
jgi:hypothetical protein